MRKYNFVTWEEDGQWTSHVPSIPGAYGLGKTASEAEADLAEQLQLLAEHMKETGRTLPRSRKTVRVGEIRI